MTEAFLDWDDWQAFAKSDLSQLDYPHLVQYKQWCVDSTVETFMPAAVLILIENLKIPQVILTVRSSRLQKHAGQVAFAGGKQDAEDVDVIATALRETEEELGVAPQQITVLGQLPSLLTVSAYQVYPVIGVLNEAVNWYVNPDEVETVFRLPLSEVMRPENYQPYWVERHGNMLQSVKFPHDSHLIWGMTATVLLGLAQSYQVWRQVQVK